MKSFAQALLAVLSATSLGLLEVDWVTGLSTAGMATILSVLTSIGSSQIGDAGYPPALADLVPGARGDVGAERGAGDAWRRRCVSRASVR